MEQRDIPLEQVEQDEFHVTKYVNALCTFIEESKTPVTIALQGKWGSGKTSFMKMIESTMCAQHVPPKKRYDSIWLNTWDLFLENDYEAAVKKLILNLMGQIKDHFEDLEEEKEKQQRKKAREQYLRGISTAVLSTLNIDTEASGNILDKVFNGGNSTAIRSVKKEFSDFLSREIAEDGNGVTDCGFLIFVDDLDRLEPRKAVTLLEALKNLFDIEGCVFILAIDYDVVAMGVREKYGTSYVGNRNIEKDFFDKLIQLPYMIPVSKYDISSMVMNRLRRIHYFEREYDYTKYEKSILEIFRLSTQNNPRMIKRLLNMIQLIHAIHQDEPSRHAEFRMMEILLLALQMTFPKIYLMLVNNSDLDVWTRYYDTSEQNEILTPEVKKHYGLDREWKEIIYLSVYQDPEIRDNYYQAARLIEMYETLQLNCLRQGLHVEEVLEIVNITTAEKKGEKAVEYDGFMYNTSSQTQYKQGTRLLGMIDFGQFSKVLDVGCGNGSITIQMWNQNRDMEVTAFDFSSSQIEIAKKNYADFLSEHEPEEFHGNIDFCVMDAWKLDAEKEYDLIFSNAALHWIEKEGGMYQRLYDALVPGGMLAVHQGGFGTYEGLHKMARQAITNLGLAGRYDNDWKFPAFYPTQREMEFLLKGIGYTDVKVMGIESDEKDNEHLIDNFANASLIYYQIDTISDEEFQAIRQEYFRLCSTQKVDKYSYRLYIFAKRPRTKDRREKQQEYNRGK